MIKNVIFDIGNVLTEFCWEEYFRGLGFSEEIFEQVANATTRNKAWNEYDRGVLSDEEVLDLFISQNPSMEKEIRLVNQNLHNILKKCDYAIPWIEELKAKGYHVYYLSNFFRKAEIECADSLNFIPYTDGGILSYKEKLIKPDAAIYELLMSRYELVAEECVFLDDKMENCQAAKALGWEAICFQNQSQAIEELKKLGVR